MSKPPEKLPPVAREQPPPTGERDKWSYYYDDATGYELYDPAQDDDDEPQNENSDDDRQRASRN